LAEKAEWLFNVESVRRRSGEKKLAVYNARGEEE
jgi:hypothetical protein